MSELIKINGDLINEVRELRRQVSETKAITEQKNTQLQSSVAFDAALRKATTQSLDMARGGYDEAEREAIKARKASMSQAEKLAGLVGLVRDRRKQNIFLVVAFAAGLTLPALLISSIPGVSDIYAAAIMHQAPNDAGRVNAGARLIDNVLPPPLSQSLNTWLQSHPVQ